MVLFYPLLCPIAANVRILDRDGKDMTEGGLESKCSDNIKSSDELAEKSSGSLGLSGAGKYNPADTENMFRDLEAIQRPFQNDSGENSGEKQSLLKNGYELLN
ncbi:MAG: hypothetical protein M3275_03885 [Thermoproteota archaeon]|nr:hypothetical protein [Thermoproteota archaeon]